MNGEKLVFIYSPQDDAQQKLWCLRLAKELRVDQAEVLLDCDEHITNRIYRIANLWAYATILVCSTGSLGVISNKLFADNFDMERLIVCLSDTSSVVEFDFYKNIIAVDFGDDTNRTNAILEVKKRVAMIVNI
jgi:hypothetical protein